MDSGAVQANCLFYAGSNHLTEVSIDTRAAPIIGAAQRFVSMRDAGLAPSTTAGFDVSADGQRFLMVRSRSRDLSESSVIVVQNWLAAQR
jgi:hypothetical protein